MFGPCSSHCKWGLCLVLVVTIVCGVSCSVPVAPIVCGVCVWGLCLVAAAPIVCVGFVIGPCSSHCVCWFCDWSLSRVCF